VVRRVDSNSARYPDHFQITVRYGDQVMTTDLIFDERSGRTTVRSLDNHASADQSDPNVRTFQLPDARAAMTWQRILVDLSGQGSLGTFGVADTLGADGEKRVNCAVHVTDVLHAGGVPTTDSTRDAVSVTYHAFDMDVPHSVFR
jgi:hypothetical protein